MCGNKSLEEWENQWQSIGKLSTCKLDNLSSTVGIYKAVLDGNIVYIGRAIEYNNGGLRKRLSDYTRASDSARKHKSGKSMYENAQLIDIWVIKAGSDSSAAKTTRELEKKLIKKYKPSWNKQLK